MGARDLVQELKQLLQKTPFLFNKGIMRTSNDVVQGFVSDLNNMKIENGVAVRRDGTARVSSSSVERHFYCMQEVSISGSRILIGVDGSRSVIAYSESFPEVDLLVRKHGISKDFKVTLNNTYNKYDTDLVIFDRGNKFFIWESSSHVYIENDIGDAVRINKFGFFRIGYNTNQESENIYNDVLAQRSSDIRNYNSVLDLDVEIVSMRKQEEFLVIEDKFKRTVPIRGTVRFAFKNEAGDIGEFSDPLFIPEYKSAFISRFAAESCKDGYVSGGYSLVSASAQSADSGYVFVEKNSNYEYVQSSYTSGGAVIEELGYQTLIYVKDIDSTKYANTGIEPGKWYIFNSYDADSNRYYVIDDHNSGKFFELHTAAQNVILTGTAGGTPYYIAAANGHAIIELMDNRNQFLSKLAINNKIDGSEFIKRPDNSIATNIVNVDLNGNAVEVKTSLPVPKNTDVYDFIHIDSTTFFSFEGALFKVQFYLKELSHDHSLYRYIIAPNYSLKYYSNFLFSSPLIGFINKGFDCWETTEEFRIDGIMTSIEPDISTGKFYIKDVETRSKYESCYAILDNNNNQTAAWMLSGDRFVTWNDGNVISESQRGFKDSCLSSCYNFMYKKASHSLTLLGNAPIMKMEKMYAPISCLEYRRLRSYPFEIKEMRRRITNAKNIIFNNHLFILQDSILLVASKDRIIISDINISSTIYDIEMFSDGILVFTSNGMYYVDRNLSVKDVVNGNGIYKKCSTNGNGSSFVLAEDNIVYYVHMIVGDNNSFFPICEPISLQLQDVYWGSNPKMTFFNNTLYVSTETDVWMFNKGIWSGKYSFANRKIYHICGWKNNLVLLCEDENYREYIPIVRPPIGIS